MTICLLFAFFIAIGLFNDDLHAFFHVYYVVSTIGVLWHIHDRCLLVAILAIVWYFSNATHEIIRLWLQLFTLIHLVFDTRFIIIVLSVWLTVARGNFSVVRLWLLLLLVFPSNCCHWRCISTTCVPGRVERSIVLLLIVFKTKLVLIVALIDHE